MYDHEKGSISKVLCHLLGCKWKFVWESRTETYSYVRCARCGSVGWRT